MAHSKFTEKTEEYLGKFKLPDSYAPPEKMEDYRAAVAGFRSFATPLEEDVDVQDLPISSAFHWQASCFRPKLDESPVQWPTVIFFPGGGFVAHLECHEGPCSKISKNAKVQVIVVHCRLAPEHPFPNGQKDAAHAVEYFYENAERFGIDRTNYFIAGDSSGGTFAAQVALSLRDKNKNILKAVLLVNPTTDFSQQFIRDDEEIGALEADAAKQDCVQDGFLDYLFRLYLTGGAEGVIDPGMMQAASPFSAESHDGLPPHYIWVSEFDMLRRHAGAYFRKLTSANVKTYLFEGKGQVHAYFGARGFLSDGQDPAMGMGHTLSGILSGKISPASEVVVTALPASAGFFTTPEDEGLVGKSEKSDTKCPSV